jgi:hypothetical protein
MTAKFFEYYITQPVRKMVLKMTKYTFYQCAAHLKNTTFFSNIKVLFLLANYITQPQPLSLGITHAFKCHYRNQLILKTAAAIDGGLIQDAAQMKLDVLFAMCFLVEAWRLITPTTIKNCFVKCSFSIMSEAMMTLQ